MAVSLSSFPATRHQDDRHAADISGSVAEEEGKLVHRHSIFGGKGGRQ